MTYYRNISLIEIGKNNYITKNNDIALLLKFTKKSNFQKVIQK